MESNRSNRILYFDFLKIISALAVILIHVCGESDVWNNNDYANPQWNIICLFMTLSRFSVPVFFMISGSLLLNNPEKYSIKRIFTHNIFHIVTALLFWSAFYTVADKLIFNPAASPMDMLNQLITGKVHMWYIFTLLLFYMITPLLHKIVENKSLERYFILLYLIPAVYGFSQFFISIPIVNNLYKNFGFAASYLIYYVSGHYFYKYEIKKSRRYVIYALGILSLAATVLMSEILPKKGIASAYTIGDRLNINIYLISVAVFVFAKYASARINLSEKITRPVSWVSRQLTFGIYLIHYFFVELAYKKGWLNVGVNVSSLYIPLLVLLFFIVSAAAIFVVSRIPVLKKYVI